MTAGCFGMQPTAGGRSKAGMLCPETGDDTGQHGPRPGGGKPWRIGSRYRSTPVGMSDDRVGALQDDDGARCLGGSASAFTF